MIAELRCGNCGKKLAENFEGRIDIACPRCKRINMIISTNHELDNVKSSVIQ